MASKMVGKWEISNEERVKLETLTGTPFEVLREARKITERLAAAQQDPVQVMRVALRAAESLISSHPNVPYARYLKARLIMFELPTKYKKDDRSTYIRKVLDELKKACSLAAAASKPALEAAALACAALQASIRSRCASSGADLRASMNLHVAARKRADERRAKGEPPAPDRGPPPSAELVFYLEELIRWCSTLRSIIGQTGGAAAATWAEVPLFLAGHPQGAIHRLVTIDVTMLDDRAAEAMATDPAVLLKTHIRVNLARLKHAAANLAAGEVLSRDFYFGTIPKELALSGTVPPREDLNGLMAISYGQPNKAAELEEVEKRLGPLGGSDPAARRVLIGRWLELVWTGRELVFASLEWKTWTSLDRPPAQAPAPAANVLVPNSAGSGYTAKGVSSSDDDLHGPQATPILRGWAPKIHETVAATQVTRGVTSKVAPEDPDLPFNGRRFDLNGAAENGVTSAEAEYQAALANLRGPAGGKGRPSSTSASAPVPVRPKPFHPPMPRVRAEEVAAAVPGIRDQLSRLGAYWRSLSDDDMASLLEVPSEEALADLKGADRDFAGAALKELEELAAARATSSNGAGPGPESRKVLGPRRNEGHVRGGFACLCCGPGAWFPGLAEFRDHVKEVHVGTPAAIARLRLLNPDVLTQPRPAWLARLGSARRQARLEADVAAEAADGLSHLAEDAVMCARCKCTIGGCFYATKDFVPEFASVSMHVICVPCLHERRLLDRLAEARGETRAASITPPSATGGAATPAGDEFDLKFPILVESEWTLRGIKGRPTVREYLAKALEAALFPASQGGQAAPDEAEVDRVDLQAEDEEVLDLEPYRTALGINRSLSYRLRRNEDGVFGGGFVSDSVGDDDDDGATDTWCPSDSSGSGRSLTGSGSSSPRSEGPDEEPEEPSPAAPEEPPGSPPPPPPPPPAPSGDHPEGDKGSALEDGSQSGRGPSAGPEADDLGLQGLEARLWNALSRQASACWGLAEPALSESRDAFRSLLKPPGPLPPGSATTTAAPLNVQGGQNASEFRFSVEYASLAARRAARLALRHARALLQLAERDTLRPAGFPIASVGLSFAQVALADMLSLASARGMPVYAPRDLQPGLHASLSKAARALTTLVTLSERMNLTAPGAAADSVEPCRDVAWALRGILDDIPIEEMVASGQLGPAARAEFLRVWDGPLQGGLKDAPLPPPQLQVRQEGGEKSGSIVLPEPFWIAQLATSFSFGNSGPGSKRARSECLLRWILGDVEPWSSAFGRNARLHHQNLLFGSCGLEHAVGLLLQDIHDASVGLAEIQASLEPTSYPMSMRYAAKLCAGVEPPIPPKRLWELILALREVIGGTRTGKAPPPPTPKEFVAILTAEVGVCPDLLENAVIARCMAEPVLGATFWRILELELSAAAWSMHSMMTGRRRDVSRRRMEMLDRRLEEARRDLAAKTGATGAVGAQGGAGRQGRSTVSLAADQQRARQAEIDLLQVDFERTKSWAAKIGGYASYSNALAGRLRREVVEILDREAAAASKGTEGGAGGQALAAAIFPDLPEAVLPWGALAAYTKSHRKFYEDELSDMVSNLLMLCHGSRGPDALLQGYRAAVLRRLEDRWREAKAGEAADQAAVLLKLEQEFPKPKKTASAKADPSAPAGEISLDANMSSAEMSAAPSESGGASKTDSEEDEDEDEHLAYSTNAGLFSALASPPKGPAKAKVAANRPGLQLPAAVAGSSGTLDLKPLANKKGAAPGASKPGPSRDAISPGRSASPSVRGSSVEGAPFKATPLFPKDPGVVVISAEGLWVCHCGLINRPGREGCAKCASKVAPCPTNVRAALMGGAPCTSASCRLLHARISLRREISEAAVEIMGPRGLAVPLSLAETHASQPRRPAIPPPPPPPPQPPAVAAEAAQQRQLQPQPQQQQQHQQHAKLRQMPQVPAPAAKASKAPTEPHRVTAALAGAESGPPASDGGGIERHVAPQQVAQEVMVLPSPSPQPAPEAAPAAAWGAPTQHVHPPPVPVSHDVAQLAALASQFATVAAALTASQGQGSLPTYVPATTALMQQQLLPTMAPPPLMWAAVPSLSASPAPTDPMPQSPFGLGSIASGPWPAAYHNGSGSGFEPSTSFLEPSGAAAALQPSMSRGILDELDALTGWAPDTTAEQQRATSSANPWAIGVPQQQGRQQSQLTELDSGVNAASALGLDLLASIGGSAGGAASQSAVSQALWGNPSGSSLAAAFGLPPQAGGLGPTSCSNPGASFNTFGTDFGLMGPTAPSPLGLPSTSLFMPSQTLQVPQASHSHPAPAVPPVTFFGTLLHTIFAVRPVREAILRKSRAMAMDMPGAASMVSAASPADRGTHDTLVYGIASLAQMVQALGISDVGIATMAVPSDLIASVARSVVEAGVVRAEAEGGAGSGAESLSGFLDSLERGSGETPGASWVSRVFGLRLHHAMVCDACGLKSLETSWVQLAESVRAVSAIQLTVEGAIRHLRGFDRRSCLRELGGCGAFSQVAYTAVQPLPLVLPVVLAWEYPGGAGDAPGRIEAAMRSISPTIDLRQVYRGLSLNSELDTKYGAKAIVYRDIEGTRYVSLFQVGSAGAWMGPAWVPGGTYISLDSWEDVIGLARSAGLLPVLVVYQSWSTWLDSLRGGGAG